MGKPKQTALVIDAIMERIENGALLPGDAVNEKDLIDVCRVSRTPVREALIQLEADGLIVRHPRKGASLFQPDTEAFLSILEVHANLEAFAAELAARRILPEQQNELKKRTDACSAFACDNSKTDPTAYYALNMHFHAIVAEASGNPYLLEMIKLNARKLMAHYRLRYRTPGAITTSAREHEQIAQYILAHDAEGARRAMLAHFNYTRETVMHMIASVR